MSPKKRLRGELEEHGRGMCCNLSVQALYGISILIGVNLSEPHINVKTFLAIYEYILYNIQGVGLASLALLLAYGHNNYEMMNS